jgi:hypothetical protein
MGDDAPRPIDGAFAKNTYNCIGEPYKDPSMKGTHGETKGTKQFLTAPPKKGQTANAIGCVREPPAARLPVVCVHAARSMFIPVKCARDTPERESLRATVCAFRVASIVTGARIDPRRRPTAGAASECQSETEQQWEPRQPQPLLVAKGRGAALTTRAPRVGVCVYACACVCRSDTVRSSSSRSTKRARTRTRIRTRCMRGRA